MGRLGVNRASWRKSRYFGCQFLGYLWSTGKLALFSARWPSATFPFMRGFKPRSLLTFVGQLFTYQFNEGLKRRFLLRAVGEINARFQPGTVSLRIYQTGGGLVCQGE